MIGVRIKSIDDGLGGGYPAPDRGVHQDNGISGRQSVFKHFPGILQDVFRYLTQIKIQITACMKRIFNERIHQPEFNILHVGILKITDLYFPHNAAPLIFRIHKGTVGVHLIVIVIVWTSFLRKISQVQHRKRIIKTGSALAVFIDLRFQDFPDERITLRFLGIYVIGSLGGAACKQRIDHIPGQFGTLKPVFQVVEKG